MSKKKTLKKNVITKDKSFLTEKIWNAVYEAFSLFIAEIEKTAKDKYICYFPVKEWFSASINIQSLHRFLKDCLHNADREVYWDVDSLRFFVLLNDQDYENLKKFSDLYLKALQYTTVLPEVNHIDISGKMNRIKRKRKYGNEV